MIRFIGDIHGAFRNLVYNIMDVDCPTNIVQVGDFGLGFHGRNADLRNLVYINEELVKVGKNLWVIRGNHDDPSYWAEGAQMFL